RSGRVLAVSVLWSALTAGLAVGLVFVVSRVAFDRFVLPTGAMAETIRGYHKEVKCPSCGYEFAVNCSREVDPQDGPSVPIVGCTCPNCRQRIRFVNRPREGVLADGTREVKDPKPSSGDHILMLKKRKDLRRLDIIVFTYPESQDEAPLMKYVKRV